MNFLFLQGPLGPFFSDLSLCFREKNSNCYKINFNFGDEFWEKKESYNNSFSFKEKINEWPVFLLKKIKKYHIDTVICYGDCRSYHKIEREICLDRNIDFFALEEGYLRPDFITLEKGGVNANSPLFNQFDKSLGLEYINHNFDASGSSCDLVIGNTLLYRSYQAGSYYMGKFLFKSKYPNYIHHRPWSEMKECTSWLKGFGKKVSYCHKDRAVLKYLDYKVRAFKCPLFLIPLQVSEDFQIRSHSNYKCLDVFLNDVIESFSKFSTADSFLLIKHHPMDRGYISYRTLIRFLSEQYGVKDRVFYGYEFPLPKLYKILKGVITINSTVGLSALLHNIPTICLGKALYNIDNLTTKVKLDEFWGEQSPVCLSTFKIFRNFLLSKTQINGSFYKKTNITAKKVAISVLNQKKEYAINHHKDDKVELSKTIL